MSKRSEQGLSLGSNMLWNSMGSFFYFACQYQMCIRDRNNTVLIVCVVVLVVLAAAGAAFWFYRKKKNK